MTNLLTANTKSAAWLSALSIANGLLSLGMIGSTVAIGINPVDAATIWNGSKITFTKANFVDWTLPENQDQITDNVSITRADFQGIFNIQQESSFSPTSPADTEWAFGTIAELESLTFQPWQTWHGRNAASIVGQDAVLHLISEDIFIDIKFLSWTGGRENGGGFSYSRSTPSTSTTVPEPTTIIGSLVALSLGAAMCSGPKS